jgi:hypothetical protein
MALSRTFRLIIATSALLAVTSCDLAQGKDEAQALADRYFAASEKGDFDSCFTRNSFSPRHQLRIRASFSLGCMSGVVYRSLTR